jgi:hypothetical protein
MRNIERGFRHIETPKRYQLSVSLEEQNHSRNIGFGGQVDRDQTWLAFKLIESEAAIGATLPRRHVEEGLVPVSRHRGAW